MISQQAFAQWAQENGTYVLERVKKANIELK